MRNGEGQLDGERGVKRLAGTARQQPRTDVGPCQEFRNFCTACNSWIKTLIATRSSVISISNSSWLFCCHVSSDHTSLHIRLQLSMLILWFLAGTISQITSETNSFTSNPECLLSLCSQMSVKRILLTACKLNVWQYPLDVVTHFST